LSNTTKDATFIVLLPIALIVILVIAGLHYFGYQQYQLIVEESTQKVNASQLNALSTIGGYYIAKGETELLSDFHASISNQPGIYGLIIHNQLNKSSIGEIDQNRYPKHLHEVNVPIEFEGQAVGSIEIVFNHEKLYTLKNNAHLLLISSFLVSVLFVIFSVWLVFKTKRQLKSKDNTAEKDQSSQSSEIDPLTKLHNKSAYDEALTKLFDEAKFCDDSLSLLLIDIDDFKLYNDNHGLQQGDLTLVAVAQAIADSLNRESDIAARISGEEFAILLPATKLGGALRVANKINDKIKALGIEHGYSKAADVVTVSIGVSDTLGDVKSGEVLHIKAEKALHLAKHRGGDQSHAAP